MSFDSTIDLTPRPSLRVLIAVFVLHTLIAAALMATLPDGPPLVVAAVGVGLSWLYVRRHPVLGLGPLALTRLTWHGDGTWTVHEASGVSHQAELQSNSFIHSQLLVLNLKLKNGQRRSRLLAGDELDAELMRRLRARLSTSGL